MQVGFFFCIYNLFCFVLQTIKKSISLQKIITLRCSLFYGSVAERKHLIFYFTPFLWSIVMLNAATRKCRLLLGFVRWRPQKLAVGPCTRLFKSRSLNPQKCSTILQTVERFHSSHMYTLDEINQRQKLSLRVMSKFEIKEFNGDFVSICKDQRKSAMPQIIYCKCP